VGGVARKRRRFSGGLVMRLERRAHARANAHVGMHAPSDARHRPEGSTDFAMDSPVFDLRACAAAPERPRDVHRHWWRGRRRARMPPLLAMATPNLVTIAPGPRGMPLLGSLGDFAWGEPLDVLLAGAQTYGDVVRFRVGPFQFHLVNHPDHIRYVLQEHSQNFVKSVSATGLRWLLGDGLLSSDGPTWLRQRRLAQPAFHRQRLAALAGTMVDATTAMLDRWRADAASRDGAPGFDVADEMMRLTLTIVARTLFGADVTRDVERVRAALEDAVRYIDARIAGPVHLPRWVPTATTRRAMRAKATLDAVVGGIIAARRAHPDDAASDLLAMFLAARDERTGAGMTDVQVRDEVQGLMVAGHETTATLLAWTWYLLSRNPDAARRVHAEVATVTGGRPPTAEDLPRLKYTAMVIDEALRLYPPAWMIERRALADDEIGGYSIPAGTMVMISPYVMHRHALYWDNPEGFDPERFAPTREATRPRFAFIPFGGGPRQCIGNGFALMEAQLVLATVSQRYALDLVPGHAVDPVTLVTLRPRRGVRVTLRAQPEVTPEELAALHGTRRASVPPA
jgi:cytochrome P450